jgi:predicted DCC family thiol-disulfide oxidoreductase YuxK
MKPTSSPASPVMLYDGVCAFCSSSVQVILKYDHRRRTMRFAAIHSPYANNVVARHPEIASIDSVILQVPGKDGGGERIYIRSTAVLEIARYLGGFWRIFLAIYIIPRPIRDVLYDLFARYRYRVFGKYDTCQIPSPEVRQRFIDVGEEVEKAVPAGEV